MSEPIRRRGLAAMFEGLACLATVFCALFAALGLTLWHGQYLAACMDRTGYPALVADGLRASCETYAQAYGLPVSALTAGWDEALVCQELLRSVDETFHLVQPARSTPFDDGVAGQLPEPAARELASLWTKAVSTPFSNLLNILLQYSRASALPVTLFLAVGAGSLALLFRASRDPGQLGGSLLEVGRAAALCAPVLPAALALLCSRMDWLPAGSLAAGLFARWAAGFFVCWALCLLAAAAAWAAMGRALKRRGPAGPKQM